MTNENRQDIEVFRKEGNHKNIISQDSDNTRSDYR